MDITLDDDNVSDRLLFSGSAQPQIARNAVMSPATADFVRRLYNLIEDPTNEYVISWTRLRDSFVVKDTTEFSKTLLPPIFNHSNFASFVRQLNKYGFHKVKKNEYNEKGDLMWTFCHPDFHADKPEALERIKRKSSTRAPSAAGTSSGSLPTSNTSNADSSSSLPYASSSSNHHHSISPFSNAYPPSLHSNSNQSHPNSAKSSSASKIEMKSEIVRLKNEGEDLRTRLRSLERSYEVMLCGLNNVEKAVAQQDRQMESLQRHLWKQLNHKRPYLRSSTPMSSSSGDPGSTPITSRGTYSAHLTFTQIQDILQSPNSFSQLQASSPQHSTGSPKRKRDDYSSSGQEEDFVNPRLSAQSSPLDVNPGYNLTEATSQFGRRATLMQTRDNAKRTAQELYASSRAAARGKGKLWTGLNFAADAQSTISEESEGLLDRFPQPLVGQQITEPHLLSWNQEWDSRLQESANFNVEVGSAASIGAIVGRREGSHSPVGSDLTGHGSENLIAFGRDEVDQNFMEGTWSFQHGRSPGGSSGPPFGGENDFFLPDDPSRPRSDDYSMMDD